jgi:hypothetical protein
MLPILIFQSVDPRLREDDREYYFDSVIKNAPKGAFFIVPEDFLNYCAVPEAAVPDAL